MIWKYPLVRALLWFVLGMAGAHGVTWPWWDLVLVIALVLALLTQPWRLWISPSERLGFGLAISTTFFALGALHYAQWITPDPSTHFLHRSRSTAAQHYVVRTLEDATARRNSTAVPVEVMAWFDSGQWMPLSGKAMLTLPAGWATELPTATTLTAHVQWKPIPPPRNPGAFDYERFLKNRQIVAQGFVREGQFTIEEVAATGGLAMTAQWRRRAEGKLQEARLSEGSRAMAQALVLGQKRDIDRDVMSQFSTTGVIHILAVSGLHVGIVLLMVQFVLKRIPWPYRYRWIPAVIAVVAVWSFAGITGFSPSVNRAATMFSFLAMSKTMGRQVPSMHGLLTSAFVLLLLFPGYLFEVGFQLSYAAVAGILLLQPWINSLIVVPWFLLRKAWEMTSVTLAAQLATFPLGMFYFSQFPFWFIPANLAILPILPLVLGAGIATLVLPSAWLTFLPVDLMLEYLLQWVVGVVGFFDSIDPGLTRQLPMTAMEMVLAFGILAMGYQAFVRKKYRMLWPALSLLMILGFLRWPASQPEWVIFSVKNNQLFGWCQEEHCQLWTTDTTDQQALAYAAEGYLKSRGLPFVTPQLIEPGVLIGPWGRAEVRASGVALDQAKTLWLMAPKQCASSSEQGLDTYEKLNYACVPLEKTGGVIVKY